MSDATSPQYRPILHQPAGRGDPIRARGGGNAKTQRPSRSRQGERLTGRFEALKRMLDEGLEVTAALAGGDPELVVVFEVIDTTKDVIGAFRKAGLEPLLDVEGMIDDDDLGDDFARLRPADPESEPIKRFLHAALANRDAAYELVGLWRRYVAGRNMPTGFTNLTQLFHLLHDVRPWGPLDRIRATGLRERVAEQLTAPDALVPVQLELWFRSSPEHRRAAEANVRALIEPDGNWLGAAVHEEIGYHGVAAEVPFASLQALLDGGIEAAAREIVLLQAPELLLVRPGGQHVGGSSDDGIDGTPAEPSTAQLGPPLLGVLDGLPATNHPRLAGRLDIVDPDDIAGDATYTSDRRRHGTEVAGMAIWGDLNRSLAPATRRVAVRPIMRPDPYVDVRECVPIGQLPADLTIRAVRDLVGPAGRAPGVRIVNLAVADPYGQFDTLPSAWARAIDHLAFEHNLLFVLAAGNHAGPLPINAAELSAATGANRDELMAEVLGEVSPMRRLLAPAESLNALTVGALHADECGDVELGYRLDPWGTEGFPSPVTSHGRGIRRAIKPDLAAPGGRQLYLPSYPATGDVTVAGATALPPGILVPIPPDRQAYERGTTFSATEVAREAVRIHDAITAPDVAVAEEHSVVATKALLVHGTAFPIGAQFGVETDRLVGNGAWARDVARGCTASQATVLFTGDLAAQTSVLLELPFPAPIAGSRDIRSVGATMAWLSPINWRHREYRQAKLTLDGPSEMSARTRTLSGPEYRLSQRGTVQHRRVETRSAFAASKLTFKIECLGQAGGFEGTVPFAVAVTIEIGADVGIDVYDLVRTELLTRVRV